MMWLWRVRSPSCACSRSCACPLVRPQGTWVAAKGPNPQVRELLQQGRIMLLYEHWSLR